MAAVKKNEEKSHWRGDGETDDIGFALQLQNSSSSFFPLLSSSYTTSSQAQALPK